MSPSTILIGVGIVCVILLGVHTWHKHLRSGCCGTDSGTAPKRIRVRDRNVHHYPYTKRLKIDGMVCGHCATTVSNALNALDGLFATVDLAEKTATVHMKTPVANSILRRTVLDVGYTVLSVTEQGCPQPSTLSQMPSERSAK
ncbi:MAG: heavy-metal-associated domain-containing protein [Ethanoligenens sp.]|uniref:heavy-metal-associated domain-containing protein n=1 Tax=Ethanoligenens sp. TaxID=2099655 RepID=UPI0039E8BFBC